MISFDPADEARHPGQEPESYWFWFAAADGELGGYAAFELTPSGDTAYHAALVRTGEPLLHVTELAAGRPRDAGLLLKAAGLWAEATCEEPFTQWTVGNECYGVELEDPWDAVGRAYGTPKPVAFDLEWYATAAPSPVPGGYEQAGEVLGRIELHEGVLDLTEPHPAQRCHVWGQQWEPAGTAPAEAEPLAASSTHLAPVRRADGSVVVMALTATAWRWWRPPPPAWPPASGATPRSPSAGC